MTTKGFVGKVALITGGGSGIGRATALAFGQEGARVVVAGRRAEEGEETVRLVAGAGGEATFLPVDVTNEAAVKGLVDRARSTYGRLDVAFNNAGNEGRPGPLVEQSSDDFAYTFDANVKGVWLSMKHEIPAMLAGGGGAIVNTASVLGLVGLANLSLYVAAKHAVVGLTKSAALEHARQNLRINAVSPGAVYTPIADRIAGGEAGWTAMMGPSHPVGRVGRPEEVAAAVLWLCGNGASFVQGAAVPVDGGWSAQ